MDNQFNTALIVIDMQNDFLQPNGILGDNYVRSNNIITNLVHILEYFRNNNGLIVWVRSKYKSAKDYTTQEIDNINTLPFYQKTHLGLDCCQPGTHGYDFYNPVKSLNRNDIVINKKWFSAFKNTKLDNLLKENNITNIVLCGVCTNVCVLSTGLVGYGLGYGVMVVGDCVGAVSLKKHQRAIDEIKKFARVVDTSELIGVELHDCHNTGFSKLLLSNLGAGDSYVIYNALDTAINYNEFKNEINWSNMSIRGQIVSRNIAIQASIVTDESGDTVEPVYRHPAENQPKTTIWTPHARTILWECIALMRQDYNHALIQLYKDGNSHIDEHSDKTLDIRFNTNIISYSMGTTRTFVFSKKKVDNQDNTKTVQEIALPNNSILVLGPRTNKEWFHSIKQDKRMPKQKTKDELSYGGERISLTFREIATFLNRNTGELFGQGAPKDCTHSIERVVEKGKMYKAFSNENHQSGFDWNENYGDGFSVVDL